jgi:isoleucyl-tRNA synthetase
MDKFYRDLTLATESENMTFDFQLPVENYVNKMLESKMQKAQTFHWYYQSVKKEMIKVRQPLQKVMIPVLDENQRLQIEQFLTNKG